VPCLFLSLWQICTVSQDLSNPVYVIGALSLLVSLADTVSQYLSIPVYVIGALPIPVSLADTVSQ
jgi:hypothetical protein